MKSMFLNLNFNIISSNIYFFKNMDLAYNFVDKTTNVTPGEILMNYRAESMRWLR
jgi:hypothetical protein